MIATTWLWLRQPETLDPANRRPLRPNSLLAAVREVLSNRTTRLSILVQTLTFGMLFSTLSSTQQIFDQTFGRGDAFHLWFGGIAVVASTGSLINARLVGQLGMRAIVRFTFLAQILLTLALIGVTLCGASGWLTFGMTVVWTLGQFYQAALTIGNLNALAMEPVGHIAGVAASTVSAVSTIGGVLIAIPIGLFFNGTALPMAVGVLICATLAFMLTTQIRRPGDPHDA